ncbi:hypothetical protein ACE7GA_27470 (plasmid) [Roseomonas sp. CCTCC AB2023176]|uniref:hypothetical protein n=1 Tax=Roseomonas sp. CCTCC AB2023176 TaxID=3342640 RepID=UPI0035D9FCD1
MQNPPAAAPAAPVWLSHQNIALAVARRDEAVQRERPPEEVRQAVQSAILGVHIALPQTMIEEAVTWVMGWRSVRLAAPPPELLGAGSPRGALATRLASQGIVVGVLGAPSITGSSLAAAAE